tara:strand:+ start:946 stop:1677 length:732 start_codon:yes stop_codon:yes gene_type:complete
MEHNLNLLIPLILILSLFQSVFGVGLLLFGTPTLLALGVPFFETLSIILPPSLSISFLQVVRNYHLIERSKELIFLIFLSLLAGLSIAIFLANNNQIELFIGLILIFISITRFKERYFNKFKSKLGEYEKFSMSFVSFIHGITNMGGGFLTYIYASKYSSKERISANIAFIYAIFAFFQIVVLLLFDKLVVNQNTLIYLIISGSAYLLIGKFLIYKINDNYFKKTITFIILFYGVISLIGSAD